jgi:hypothetical protein
VGHSARCSCAPQSGILPGRVPPWESFPEVNRVAVQRLLGLLVERMAGPLSSGGGGERDGDADQAVQAG